MIELTSLVRYFGPIWINPALIAVIRPRTDLEGGSDIYGPRGEFIAGVREAPEKISDLIRIKV